MLKGFFLCRSCRVVFFSHQPAHLALKLVFDMCLHIPQLFQAACFGLVFANRDQPTGGRHHLGVRLLWFQAAQAVGKPLSDASCFHVVVSLPCRAFWVDTYIKGKTTQSATRQMQAACSVVSNPGEQTIPVYSAFLSKLLKSGANRLYCFKLPVCEM